jgi:hypothetical protein
MRRPAMLSQPAAPARVAGTIPSMQQASTACALELAQASDWPDAGGRGDIGRVAGAVQEIKLLERISHDRNIVQFYGACLETSPPMLVMEFMGVRAPGPRAAALVAAGPGQRSK